MKIFATGIIFLVLPKIVFAAGITALIDTASGIVTSVLIPLAFALCLFYFFWGVAKYIRTGAGGEKIAEEGRRVMVRGIIALFIVSCIWGIIAFMKSELGIPPNVENPSAL